MVYTKYVDNLNLTNGGVLDNQVQKNLINIGEMVLVQENQTCWIGSKLW